VKKHKSGTRFSMQAQGDSAEILIYEEIGSSFWGGGVSPIQFAQDLKALGDIKTLSVRINSPGGDVFDGATIYNQLVQHPATVTVYVDGLAASAASLVAMAGDKICMADNAMMMIHNAWGCMAGDANDLRTFADILQKVSETMCATYAKRSGMKAADVQKLMDKETWFNAQECVDEGLADEIVQPAEANASASAKVLFDLSHFKNVPKGIVQQPAASQSTITPPDFYRVRLKLYERAHAR
jgi:ATP-dependent Clp endopeptidase proteolytic subunit ClpP